MAPASCSTAPATARAASSSPMAMRPMSSKAWRAPPTWHRAIAAGTTLAAEARKCPAGAAIDLAAEFGGHFLAPIDHEDPAHLALTGTGLTHLGSAEGRDKMHREAAAAAHQTDSMRMFLEGLEGGKPAGAASASSPNGSTRAMAASLSAPASRWTCRLSRRMAARSRNWPGST
jgi:hypothetical protein